MSSKRKQKYHSYANTYPSEKTFVDDHAKLNDLDYPEAYNNVMAVMRTIQDMLLTHRRFMLPGIGIIGIAENVKRGIVLASSGLWWTPGLLNVLTMSPGWENAPLNTYLTDENIDSINSLYADLASKEKILYNQKQYYNASDFGGDEKFTSYEKLAFYAEKQKVADEKREYKEKRHAEFTLEGFKTRQGFRVAWLKAKVKRLEQHLQKLGVDITLDETLEDALGKEFND